MATAALVIAAMLVASASIEWWLRSRPTVHTAMVTTRGPLPPVDIVDCPTVTPCVGTTARAPVLRVLRSQFPGASTLDDWGLVGRDGHAYTESVSLRTPDGVVESFAARCPLTGAPVPDHRIAGTSPGGGTWLAVVVGGASGCSVAVTLVGPARARLPLAAAERVAHTAELQLPSA